MGFSVSDLVTSDTGDYVTTDAGDRIFVRYTNDPFTPSLSFVGNLSTSSVVLKLLTAALSFVGSITRLRAGIFTATLAFVGTFKKRYSPIISASVSFVGNMTPGFGHLYSQALSAALSFSGFISKARKKLLTAALSFVGTLNKFAPFIHLSSALSFVGSIRKRSPKSFTGTLSFVGTFSRTKLFLKAMVAALSFVGSFRGYISRKRFTASLSWIGDLSKKFDNTFFKTLSSSLSFAGSRVSSSTHRLLLRSIVRFRGFAPGFFSRLQVNIMTYAEWFLQSVVGFSSFVKKVAAISTSQQTVSPSVAQINLGDLEGLPIPALFIKNLDEVTSVEIDISSSFDQFPQVLYPGMGILLSPSMGSSLWAHTLDDTLTADIQVIIGG